MERNPQKYYSLLPAGVEKTFKTQIIKSLRDVVTAISELEYEESREIFSWLYWEFNEEEIKESYLAKLIGITISELIEYYIIPLADKCCADYQRMCGEAVVATSRKEYRQIVLDYDWDDTNTIPFGSTWGRNSVDYCIICRRMFRELEVEEEIEADVKRRLPAHHLANGIRQRIAKMPHSKYIHSSHWRWLRKLALEYADNRCQLCNSNSETLHLHHRTYARRGEELLRDVIVLCAECHCQFHNSFL